MCASAVCLNSFCNFADDDAEGLSTPAADAIVADENVCPQIKACLEIDHTLKQKVRCSESN
jgi:hypothetical protein